MLGHPTSLVVAVSLLLSVSEVVQLLADTPKNLLDESLVAWCIVPFDGKNRGPAERAEMVKRLGLRRVAYDWRAKHVPEFEEEILQYKKHGIEYFAFWGVHDEAFKLFKKHGLRPQIWKTLPSPAEATQEARVKAAAVSMLPLVERTRELGSKLGLYNHGGWGGEPENLVAVCRYLREHQNGAHVGIVYNQHHAHGHIDDFAESIKLMQPYLLCLNLNGMTRDGDKRGRKILPLGVGEFDVQLLKAIRNVKYDGPIGIIGHTQDDVELRLRDNLDGLHWLLPQLDDKSPGERPKLRTWSHTQPKTEDTSQSSALPRGIVVEGRPELRQPPLTIECRCTLPDARGYNILVASDTKRSGQHWEVFSMNGSGTLTAYLPGMKPDHVRSEAVICDRQPHTIAMQYESRRVRLFVDGKQVAEQGIEPLRRSGVPGGFAIGQLVEGGLGCRGTIEWVRVSSGIRAVTGEPVDDVEMDDRTLLLWRNDQSQAIPKAVGYRTPAYSREIVARLVKEAQEHGNQHRGLLAFASAKSACVSCHKIGRHGGTIGPDLTEIAKQRKPDELVESVLWPQRQVKPEYVAHAIVDVSGRTRQGYILRRDAHELVFRDVKRPELDAVSIPLDEIEELRSTGTLMPDNLAATMSPEDLLHLLSFVFSLGTGDGPTAVERDALLEHAQAHLHGPAEFTYELKPLKPELWPNWQHHVNRDRVYDFYAKQADHFRMQSPTPPLLQEFPGLDGGQLGHWGNQNDSIWADDRWNDTRLSSVMSGVFRGQGVTVPRAVCVQLGERGEMAACFNPDKLTYDAVWTGGFVKFSDRRHGFVSGLAMDGKAVPRPILPSPNKPFEYHGFYRLGKRVIFSYSIDGKHILDAPEIKEGKFSRDLAIADRHPLRDAIKNPPAQWPEEFETDVELGDGSSFVVDTINLPFENPWNALMFCGGHAFLADGSALVCTMQGDVWRVTGFEYPSRKAKWRRFAAGLHHPLGIVIDDDGIFVLGRDQITRLHDLNNDGEADFYECYSNAHQTSSAGHDFIAGLERDADGRFYTASGNQGLVRISADGKQADVIATGFRNPDGLGLMPDGTVTVPCSEGGWTPASMICAVQKAVGDAAEIPHFGYRGPRNGKTPELPLVYLPRGLDNSSGGQVYVESENWGPLTGKLLHFSFGTGTQFLVLRDEVGGQMQGAIVPLPGDFLSGAHRGRFSPKDGQLYVTGMQGWGSYTPDDGCFHRVRFTGGKTQLPVGFHVHENGVKIEFALPLDKATAGQASSHFAQCWNYRYGPGYGSPEFSSRHAGMKGHDALTIASSSLLKDGRTLFLQLPEIQPVNQLHLRLQSAPERFHDLFVTVHKLDEPFTDFPDYREADKEIRPHPILGDLAMITRSVPNPFQKKLKEARAITVETGTNLSFKTEVLRVTAGEAIALTLSNPDVVPHNWALVEQGRLEEVGALADRLISDPDAALRHYIPRSSHVLAHTDVVLPRDRFTIYFRAPEKPGRYPYLCTFPGHWKVMNGVMIVE